MKEASTGLLSASESYPSRACLCRFLFGFRCRLSSGPSPAGRIESASASNIVLGASGSFKLVRTIFF